MKKVLMIILAVLLVLALVVGGFCIWIAAHSAGKLPELRDANGEVIENSISEKVFVEIGGIEQGMFIRSENPGNPVILFLHGGPGSPELPLTILHEEAECLERYFTVCYWDQRGAGMTYSSSLDPETLTMERMVEDTREVTKYLTERFGVDKVIVAGHSWGSYLGVKTIEKYPELYHAYIGIGQVTNQTKSEKLAYDYMLDFATQIGDKQAVKLLEEYDRDAEDFPNDKYMMNVRTNLMNRFGVGMTHKRTTMREIVKMLLTFRGYTFGEKIGYVKGMVFSQERLFAYVWADNLFESSTKFEIPFYVVHGEYDYQVSYELAKEYFELVSAPKGEFITFENSAHSPNMEESVRFTEVVRRIAAENGIVATQPDFGVEYHDFEEKKGTMSDF